jgi:hypothetical protein
MSGGVKFVVFEAHFVRSGSGFPALIKSFRREGLESREPAGVYSKICYFMLFFAIFCYFVLPIKDAKKEIAEEGDIVLGFWNQKEVLRGTTTCSNVC